MVRWQQFCAVGVLLGSWTAHGAATERPLVPPSTRGVSPDKLLRLKATLLRAEDTRRMDDAVRAALAHPQPEIRSAAALAVGRIGDPRERPALERALHDPVPAVRASATFALGLLDAPEALEALGSAAQDADASVRARAAAALGMLQAPSGIGLLEPLLRDPDPGVVAAACYALARYEQGSIDVGLLVSLSEAEEPGTSLAAIHVLSRLAAVPSRLSFDDKRKARERLRALRLSRDVRIRMLVAQGFALPSSIEDAKLLGQLLEDRDPRVRVSATRSLCFAGAPLEPYVNRALKASDALVVLAAVEGLGRMRGPDAVNRLVEIVARDRRRWLREKAVESMGQADPDMAAAVANGLSRDEDPTIRAASAKLLLGRTDAASLAIATRLLGDQDPRPRTAAIPLMAGAEGPLAELVGRFVGAVSMETRAAVAQVSGTRLGSAGGPELRQDALSLLERLWDGSAKDRLPLVREKVIEAAAKAGEDPRAQALLRRGLDCPSQSVRWRASRALADHTGDARVGGHAAPNRPLKFYMNVLRWAERPRAATVAVERPGFLPGRFTLSLDTVAAPLTAWSFAELAEEGFYDGMVLHRVVPNFLVQGGDPIGDGEGGPGYVLRDELQPGLFEAGTLGMASTGKDSAGSQWFVTLADQPQLQGRYTAFGKVVQNFAGVVSLLLPHDRVISIRMREGSGAEPLTPITP